MTRVLFRSVVLIVGLAELADAQAEPRIPSTLREGLLARFDEAAAKVMQLAEAMPAESYGWRPALGVRSVSEVLVHLAQGNYYTTDDAGLKRPPEFRHDAETTVTEKAQVLRYLRTSNDHMHRALATLSESDLQRPTTMFRQQTIYGNVYLFGIAHVHEHLGQLIAYARTNGVAPPWSGR